MATQVTPEWPPASMRWPSIMGKGDTIYQADVALLERPVIRLAPGDDQQLWAAVVAHRNFGRRRHPVRLGFGDTFGYALAQSRALPFPYRGDDLAQADMATTVAKE